LGNLADTQQLAHADADTRGRIQVICVSHETELPYETVVLCGNCRRICLDRRRLQAIQQQKAAMEEEAKALRAELESLQAASAAMERERALLAESQQDAAAKAAEMRREVDALHAGEVALAGQGLEKAASASQLKEQHEVSSGSLVLDIRRVWKYLRVSTERQKRFGKEDNSIELQVCMSVFYAYMYGFYYLTCFFPCRGGTAANVSRL
jgi:multidrug efflux pump subunit AcrA (membrane-fusion protein)